jgi:hypothetical protein
MQPCQTKGNLPPIPLGDDTRDDEKYGDRRKVDQIPEPDETRDDALLRKFSAAADGRERGYHSLYEGLIDRISTPPV